MTLSPLILIAAAYALFTGGMFVGVWASGHRLDRSEALVFLGWPVLFPLGLSNPHRWLLPLLPLSIACRLVKNAAYVHDRAIDGSTRTSVRHKDYSGTRFALRSSELPLRPAGARRWLPIFVLARLARRHGFCIPYVQTGRKGDDGLPWTKWHAAISAGPVTLVDRRTVVHEHNAHLNICL